MRATDPDTETGHPAYPGGDGGGAANAPDASGETDVNDEWVGPAAKAADSVLASNPANPVSNNKSSYASAQTDDPANREVDDFYPTWPAATEALLRVESFDGPIWEPACGEGDMSRVLESAGYEVFSTDLIDRGYGEAPRDFLMEWTPRAPNVVTNPPFREAKPFVDRALMLTTGKVAMFLRLAFLEGIERGVWFPQTPLERVWVMSRRVPMGRGSLSGTGRAGVIAFAWFIWNHAHKGEPAIGFLDWKGPA